MLRSNKNTFEILSKALSEVVIIVDENQVIVATNTAANTMFGYDKDELKDQPLNILIPNEEKQNKN